MHASVKTLLAGESERVSIIAPLEPDDVAREAMLIVRERTR
jgi:hypothetical protein